MTTAREQNQASGPENNQASEAAITYINPEITESETRAGNVVELPYGFGPIPSHLKNKKVFYFDIDNCLYKRSTNVHEMMQVKIHQFFKDQLHLNDEDAHNLHMKYYQVYGLAVEGLVRNHNVDALLYNSQVDDALDLKPVLKYDEELRQMLISIKQHHNFDFIWLITNAYKNHALRVVSFLGIGDLFDGLTFCDYAKYPIVCKPMTKFFNACFTSTNIDFNDKKVVSNQSFIDDSELNVKAAFNLGFGTVIHYVERDQDLEVIKAKPDFNEYYGDGKIKIIRDILDVPKVIPPSD